MKLIRDKKTQEKPIVDKPTADDKPQVAGQLLRSLAAAANQPVSRPTNRSTSWKILVVDDEPEVHAVTKLSVGDLEFENKPVQLLNAMSGIEAQEILVKEHDIAVALIDVVMETEDAGLRLVEYIRKELKNQRIRLIIRTGQPGVAPERYVIDHYDIDDYKDKTELTTQRLYTTLRTTLKAYRDLTIIDNNRQGLEKILTAAPNLYRIQPMEQFLQGVLTQITNLCPVGENSLIATLDDGTPTVNSKIAIWAGTGQFVEHNTSQTEGLIQTCESLLLGNQPEVPLPPSSLLLPLELYDNMLGFIYLEEVGFLNNNDRYLLQIMTTQCAAALKNIKLYLNLDESNKQNERKNLFLGMAAHDLRNPLGVIQGYGSLLMLDAYKILNSEQLEYLDEIQKTSQFMQRLINDLLEVAKIESGQLELELEATDISTIIMQGVMFNQLLADTKQIVVRFDADETLPQVKLDASRIQQVLNNLISNAIKYSHSHTNVQVSVTQTENDLLISVKDEGQGIPEKELGKLFQPFSMTSVKSTAGEQSTGLGLLICRQIVESHHGKIWVESQQGVGSTFYVSLPIAGDEY